MSSLSKGIQKFAQTPCSRRYPQRRWNLPVWAVSENVSNQESSSYSSTNWPHVRGGKTATGIWFSPKSSVFLYFLNHQKRLWAAKSVEKKWWRETLRNIFDTHINQKDTNVTCVMQISTGVSQRFPITGIKFLLRWKILANILYTEQITAWSIISKSSTRESTGSVTYVEKSYRFIQTVSKIIKESTRRSGRFSAHFVRRHSKPKNHSLLMNAYIRGTSCTRASSKGGMSRPLLVVFQEAFIELD